jgi:RimJ/RimL family protein N-acetyltransferase
MNLIGHRINQGREVEWAGLRRCSLLIRTIRADDAELLQAYVRKLSATSRYNRFLGALNELPAAEVDRLVHIEPRDGTALVVETQGRGRDREIIAEGRCMMLRDGLSCEIAFSVTDDWQRQGLGAALLRHLLRHAASIGAKLIVADALSTNEAIKALARGAGFAIERSADDPRLLRLTMGIEPSRASTPERGHSTLAPENFTTFAHFSVSSALIAPNSVGVVTSGAAPRSASRALKPGSASAAFISLFK